MPSSVVLTMPGYWPAPICFFSPSPLGPPAMLTNVGSQSRDANISFLTVPGLITPGQRITIGARMPPSQVVSFPPLKGVVPPSGKVMISAPFRPRVVGTPNRRNLQTVSTLLAAGDCAGWKRKAVTCNISGCCEPDPILQRVLYAIRDGLPQRPQPKRLPNHESVQRD